MLCATCQRQADCPLKELLAGYSASLGLATDVTDCRKYLETPQHLAMRELFFGTPHEQAN